MTPKELDRVIGKAIEGHARWLAGEDGARRMEFRDTDLRGAVLSRFGTPLHAAIFARCDLTEAYMRGVDLAMAHFRGAILDRAKMMGARLIAADLSCAKLRGANLRCAALMGASLRDADLTDADLCGAMLYGADLTGACVDRACFTDVLGLTNEQLAAAGVPGAEDGRLVEFGLVFAGEPYPGYAPVKMTMAEAVRKGVEFPGQAGADTAKGVVTGLMIDGREGWIEHPFWIGGGSDHPSFWIGGGSDHSTVYEVGKSSDPSDPKKEP